MQLLLRMAVSVISLSGMAAAQLSCDPLTQYERNGDCCKMCAPGTRMSSLSTCLDPQCPECGDNEYRETYTTEPRCRRQPYCDPHKNFGAIVHKSKSQRSACECKLGFHCSSGDCITCVPHTLCGPGHGARSTGNRTQNTACQKCTEGTFSEDESWNGVCEKWTECLEGHNVEQSGTGVSDNICEETSRSHAVVIVVCSVIVSLFVVICACWWCLCKGKPGDAKGNVKVCVELCLGNKKEPLRETRVLITNPTDAIEDESLVPDRQSSQEEADARTPEENEDELSQELSDDYVLTDNGNVVTQEDGKSAVLSRQESQTQTLQTETSCGHSDRWG